MSDIIDSYLSRLNWKNNENSNRNFSLSDLNHAISSTISKEYWLDELYTETIKKSHNQGDLHIHDLNQLSVYCVGWDLYDLLIQGFGGVSNRVSSGPAKHFRVALGQIVNFIYTLQGEASGAQAFSSFDTLLAPFVRQDKLSYSDVKQAMQEFIFNLNVPTRASGETPFSNLTFDLNPSTLYKNKAVIIGGKPQNITYGDYQAEMDLINRAFLEVMSEGDFCGRVFTFPVPTYNITKDFNWNSENLKPLWEVTAKYGIPYFANYINADMEPEDAKSMCCRLRLSVKELNKRGGGLFGSNPLTGSIGVVTINLPKIGYLAKDESEFLNQLKDLMLIAKESLAIKRDVIERFADEGLYPYAAHYLTSVKQRTGKYWSNHFSTIGLIGMHEASLNLFGFGLETEKGRDFAERTLVYMRDVLKIFQDQTDVLFNLEATPAEGTTYRLAKKDKELYPDCNTAGELEPFYTNSTLLPVDYDGSVLEVLQLQDKLQNKYTGGTVQHCFLGEAVPDPNAVKEFVKLVCTRFTLPYISITPSFSICTEHGYLRGELPNCPTCSRETEIYSRVVGYLRPTKQWNIGKREEFRLRKNYTI